jgi:predicted dehydrogenase
MGRSYTEFLHRLPGVDVTAVCDLDHDLAREVGKAAEARVIPKAEDLAMLPDVDAVFVCTPEYAHVEPAVAALNAGKAVMIEKPVAHTLEAAQAIADAADASGTTVMVAHILRFEPRWVAARKAVAAGDIGDVVSIATRRVGNVLDQRVLQGRTSIPLYYGVHDLDVVRWFAGAEATKVYASRRAGVLQKAGYDINDLYCAVFEFENGILASAELGWHVPAAAVSAPSSGLTVVGTQGYLEVDQAQTGLRLYSEKERPSVHAVIDVTFWPEIHGIPGGALADELRHFVECVESGAEPIITLNDAVVALRMSLAMEASAEKGEPIALSGAGHFDIA